MATGVLTAGSGGLTGGVDSGTGVGATTAVGSGAWVLAAWGEIAQCEGQLVGPLRNRTVSCVMPKCPSEVLISSACRPMGTAALSGSSLSRAHPAVPPRLRDLP